MKMLMDCFFCLIFSATFVTTGFIDAMIQKNTEKITETKVTESENTDYMNKVKEMLIKNQDKNNRWYVFPTAEAFTIRSFVLSYKPEEKGPKHFPKKSWKRLVEEICAMEAGEEKKEFILDAHTTGYFFAERSLVFTTLLPKEKESSTD